MIDFKEEFMNLISWLALIGVCAVGAMSPGPSLAVILQNRMQRSLSGALVASWSHAAGIFFWALAASTALGSLLRSVPAIRTVLTAAGALFLIYLATTSWRNGASDHPAVANKLPPPWLSGLSISLLNPKIFVFFTAVFTQFIPATAKPITLLGFASVALLVDGIWYTIVSLLIGHKKLERVLNNHSIFINRIAAAFYLILAIFSLVRII